MAKKQSTELSNTESIVVATVVAVMVSKFWDHTIQYWKLPNLLPNHPLLMECIMLIVVMVILILLALGLASFSIFLIKGYKGLIQR